MVLVMFNYPTGRIVNIGVVTRLMHVSGQWLENEFTLPMVKSDPQAAGSAITYARRYALQALFGIPAVDDDGEAAVLRGSQQPTVPDKYEELVDKLSDSIEAIKTGIEIGDLVMAKEAWSELTEEEKEGIWKAPSKGGVFTTEERSIMKSTEFRTATRRVTMEYDNTNRGDLFRNEERNREAPRFHWLDVRRRV